MNKLILYTKSDRRMIETSVSSRKQLLSQFDMWDRSDPKIEKKIEEMIDLLYDQGADQYDDMMDSMIEVIDQSGNLLFCTYFKYLWDRIGPA